MFHQLVNFSIVLYASHTSETLKFKSSAYSVSSWSSLHMSGTTWFKSMGSGWSSCARPVFRGSSPRGNGYAVGVVCERLYCCARLMFVWLC